MTYKEAEKLKWGTVLEPSKTGKNNLKEYRDAIFLGIAAKGYFIKVVVRGDITDRTYSPVFWKVKPTVKINMDLRP